MRLYIRNTRTKFLTLCIMLKCLQKRPGILNPGTIWRGVVNFTLLPIYHRKESSEYSVWMNGWKAIPMWTQWWRRKVATTNKNRTPIVSLWKISLLRCVTVKFTQQGSCLRRVKIINKMKKELNAETHIKRTDSKQHCCLYIMHVVSDQWCQNMSISSLHYDHIRAVRSAWHASLATMRTHFSYCVQFEISIRVQSIATFCGHVQLKWRLIESHFNCFLRDGGGWGLVNSRTPCDRNTFISVFLLSHIASVWNRSFLENVWKEEGDAVRAMFGIWRKQELY